MHSSVKEIGLTNYRIPEKAKSLHEWMNGKHEQIVINGSHKAFLRKLAFLKTYNYPFLENSRDPFLLLEEK